MADVYTDVNTTIDDVVEAPDVEEELITDAVSEDPIEEVETTTPSAEDMEASGGNDPGKLANWLTIKLAN